ncbi:MAG: hypothetical protein IJQ00_02480, partial [Kiritimatiellae bacterium]|nr:hypothetical protein [Kiritimatiellia bacterium]
ERGYGIIVPFPRRDGIGWVVGAEVSSRLGCVRESVHNPTQLGKFYSTIQRGKSDGKTYLQLP